MSVFTDVSQILFAFCVSYEVQSACPLTALTFYSLRGRHLSASPPGWCSEPLSAPVQDSEPRLSFHKLEKNSIDSYPQGASMNTLRMSDCPAVRCVSAGLLSPLPVAFHMLMALPSTRPTAHTRHTTFLCPLGAWKTSAWQQPASFGCMVSMVTQSRVQKWRVGPCERSRWGRRRCGTRCTVVTPSSRAVLLKWVV